MQASCGEQSELTTHSGRQFGGEPIMPGRQEQWQRSPITRGGPAFAPHGSGLQGSASIGWMVGGGRLQAVKGSPLCPGKQVQVARWFTTRHSALVPQSPGQGSTQCRFLQARSDGHSGLIVHSGLQATYGSPKYSGIHRQEPARFLALQIAFDPQGDGLQGSIISVGVAAKKM